MTDMAILHLTLKREWFDQIACGEKKEEFRQYKPYWKKRLERRKYDAILFRNGYASNAPEMLVEYPGLDRDGSGQTRTTSSDPVVS
jgi:hypothetical protein